ncbi:MAG: tRNA pseudouridine(38-40) synthase TruA [Myxococcales bacterium]|nr:tRNA pseudouridine(38-40) synthase TruA [Myxococcales bacterium]
MRDSPFSIMAVWCWYDGAAFHGYQGQQGLRTVQSELMRAFAAAGLSRNPVVAGRTDKGVSARMQVLSARLERDVSPSEAMERLTPHLPDDLGLVMARDAKPGFHAAWSATSKEYRYTLTLENAGDLSLLERAAALIPGTRDFRVFHFKTSEQKPRTVDAVEVHQEQSAITVRVRGQQFARHMVRMLIGGMTAVARGEVSLDVFHRGLIEQQNFHCPTAPPEPLTLWNVGYPDDVDPFTIEERQAFVMPVTRGRTPTPHPR